MELSSKFHYPPVCKFDNQIYMVVSCFDSVVGANITNQPIDYSTFFLSFAKKVAMYKNFKTRIKVKAEMEDAFAAFINPFTIELWSGYPAVISKEPNSEFSLWEGDIVGRVLEVDDEKKIVQEWYFGEQPEPSIVTLKFFLQSGERIQIDLEHTNIPDEAYDDIVEGWNDYYLGAIKTFLEVQ